MLKQLPGYEVSGAFTGLGKKIVTDEIVFAAFIDDRFKPGGARVIPDDTARYNTVCHTTQYQTSSRFGMRADDPECRTYTCRYDL